MRVTASALFISVTPSWLKVRIYRLLGAQIGKRTRIGFLSVLLSKDVVIGDDCRVGMASVVAARKVRIGNRARIGSLVVVDTNEFQLGHDSVIMELNVVGGMRTPRSRLEIGSRVKVFPFCFINPTEPIAIEDDVGIGGSNFLFTHGSWQPILDGFPVSFGPIRIRRGAWLPWRVFVLPDVEIGECATIGAGAVVTRSVPDYSLARGVPARSLPDDRQHIKPLRDDEKWALLVRIFREYADLLIFDGLQPRVSEQESQVRLETSVGASKSQSVLVLVRDSSDVESISCDVVVSLTCLSREVRTELNRCRVSWFDIEAREMEFGRAECSHEVRAFLSRYGVRFAVASDPPWVSARSADTAD